MPEIEVLCIYQGMPRFLTEKLTNSLLELEGKKLVQRESGNVPNLNEWGVCEINQKEPTKWIPFGLFEELSDKYVTIITYGSRDQLLIAFQNLAIIRNRGFAAQVAEII